MIDKKTKLIMLLFASILLFFIFKEVYERYLLSNCDSFTIGKVLRVGSNIKSGAKYAELAYTIDNKTYVEKCLSGSYDIYKNQIFYLRYACNNPTIIEGIWDKKVDSLHLKNLPPEGWDKLPE